MASYLRPRRGKKATAEAQLTASAPLKRGEVFFEVPDDGVGTGIGKIKMGDGSTAYASLPYFLESPDPDDAVVGFTNSTEAESDPYTTNATHTAAIVPTASLKTIFTNLKQLLLNYNSQLTTLNNDSIGKFNGYSNNGIYRGKNLGTITSSNIDAFLTEHKVSSGVFEDLYVGDIITIQDGTYNAQWLIAGFNTELNKGDTALTTNHISLIPVSKLLDAPMNSSHTTSGGYKGSIMHSTTLPTVAANLKNALGSHLLNRRVLLSNATATGTSMAGAGYSGYSSNWEWCSAYCTLMTEVQCYGSTVFSSSFFDVGEGYEKLPIFNFIHPVTFARVTFWLRAVANSTYFALVSDYGYAGYIGAGRSYGVRPLITIG